MDEMIREALRDAVDALEFEQLTCIRDAIDSDEVDPAEIGRWFVDALEERL